MPAVGIKAAIKTLLEASFVSPTGDGRLKHVFTQYPRPGEHDGAEDFPRVTVWATRHPQQKADSFGRSGPLAGQPTPPIGYRVYTWEIMIHLKQLMDDPITQGDAFDLLADDIEQMLTQWPTLNGALGTTIAGTGFNAMDWKVDWSGDISRETVLPLIGGELQISYNVLFTLRVTERIKA